MARKGDLNAAEACQRNATKCPEGPIDEAYLNLGYDLRARERYAEALESFNKALEITPDYEEALVGRADMEKAIAFLSANEEKVKTRQGVASS